MRRGLTRRREDAEEPSSYTALRLPPGARVQDARAAVLLLHGGRTHGLGTPRRWNLAAARMRPFARCIARATAGRGVLVGSVRYRHSGWNGSRADAARDTRQALDELRDLAGPLPVVLVGHSMGGRAALSAGDHPLVSAVVGLAPWCPDGEPAGHLGGRRIVLLHGDHDRMTDPADSRDFVRRAGAAGADARYVLMPGGNHSMLRRPARWHSLTTRVVTGLLGFTPLPPEAVRAATQAAGHRGLPEG